MSRFKQFCEPHCHPKSLDSGSRPSDFAKREVELGSGSLTCTDHGTLGASREIYDLAKENELIPICGLESYFRDDNCSLIKDATGMASKDYAKYYHLTLHCLDLDAYHVLCRVLSKATQRAERHGSEKKPLFDWASLQELGQYNIVATSSCLIGIFGRHLMAQNNLDLGMAYLNKVRSLFKPGNFYVEIFPHVCNQFFEKGVYIHFQDGSKAKYSAQKKLRTNLGDVYAMDLNKEFNKKGNKHTELNGVMTNRKMTDVPVKKIVRVEYVEDFMPNECRSWSEDGDYQKSMNLLLMDVANKEKLPILISGDSHLAVPEHKIVQDVRLAQSGNWKFPNPYYRQSSDDVWPYFKDKLGISEATFESWIDNSHEWRDRFKGFIWENKPSLPLSFYPKDILKHIMDRIEYQGRVDWENEEQVKRLKYEITILHKNKELDWLPYFAVTEDICYYFERQRDLNGCGRGSSGGVELMYALGVTHIDPLKYDLSFERFITEDRLESGAWPDADLDFPSVERLVDDHEVEKYEILLDNGQTMVLGLYDYIETSGGKVTAKEAFERGYEING